MQNLFFKTAIVSRDDLNLKIFLLWKFSNISKLERLVTHVCPSPWPISYQEFAALASSMPFILVAWSVLKQSWDFISFHLYIISVCIS